MSFSNAAQVAFLCPGWNVLLVSMPALCLLALFLSHQPNHLYFTELLGWITSYSNKDWVYGKYLEPHGPAIVDEEFH